MDSKVVEENIFVTLKQVLKNKKITYKNLAKKLGTTESGIKNIFYTRNVSTRKLIDICFAIDVSLTELINMADRLKENYFSLTKEQEKFFSQNPHYFYFFREHHFQKKTLAEIKRKYQLSDKSIFAYLRKLESLDLLEVHPGNKVKYKVSGKQRWSDDGPWMKAFVKPSLNMMIDHIGGTSKSKLNYSSMIKFATLTNEMVERMIFEIQSIEAKYQEIAYQDFLMGLEKKGVPISWSFNVANMDVYQDQTKIINI